MKLKNPYISSTLFFLLCLIVLCLPYRKMGAQSLLTPPLLFENKTVIKPADTIRVTLSFAIDSLLEIKDETNHLEPVFKVIDELSSGKDTLLTIVHLGDSHIQAGHFSGRMMRLLQQQFGNAGRGWISPFKLTRTNEPDDYFLRSSAKEWIAGRIIQRQKKTPIGPGGIGIKTISSSVNFDIVIAPNNGAGYEFNQAVLYRGDKSTPMLPAGSLKEFVTTSRSIETLAPRLVTDTFRISKQTDMFQLHSTRRKPGTDTLLPESAFSNIYYGFSLSNSNPGILYHAIGVNGAMYVNYTDHDFMQRLAVLKPDLLIVSLGTNETFGTCFNEREFRQQIREFLHMVRLYIPNTKIVLTTPPECYKRIRVNKKRTYVRNTNTQKAASAIRNQAKQENIAYWDLFGASGGRESYKKWYNGGYLGRDRIHYTKSGYQEQANLFFISWMKTLSKRETTKQEETKE